MRTGQNQMMYSENATESAEKQESIRDIVRAVLARGDATFITDSDVANGFDGIDVWVGEDGKYRSNFKRCAHPVSYPTLETLAEEFV